MTTVYIIFMILITILLAGISNKLSRIRAAIEKFPSPITAKINGDNTYYMLPVITSEEISRYTMRTKDAPK